MIVFAETAPVIPAWLDQFPTLKAVYKQWMGRELVPIEEFNALSGEMKTQAFSAVATMNDVQRQKLLDALGRAISEGLTVKDVRDLVSPILENSAYADLVFGQNVSNAARGGQYAEIFGSLGADWPFWKYHSLHDDRNDEPSECPHVVCRALDGKIFSKADAVGWRLLPPNHFKCRCYVEEISASEAASSTVERGSRVRADPNFDYDKRSLAPLRF